MKFCCQRKADNYVHVVLVIVVVSNSSRGLKQTDDEERGKRASALQTPQVIVKEDDQYGMMRIVDV